MADTVQRRFFRRIADGGAVRFRYVEGGGEVGGWLLDIGAGGLAFETHRPVAPGSLIEARVSPADGSGRDLVAVLEVLRSDRLEARRHRVAGRFHWRLSRAA
ncbi:MAG: hypothetical protein D6729_04460 [Deltaproteobacteria bacterium]|nr:MAG: hypothetical protein D6729_04460 [Deltaproteobacteria bacterium]